MTLPIFQMQDRTPPSQNGWIFCALAAILSAGCQETKYSTAELERFGDSVTGSGRVRYAEVSYGKWELTIEVGLLQPGEDYWLCINAAFPDSKVSDVLGSMKHPAWPPGGFRDDPDTRSKEGFWNFAAVRADSDGTYSGTFLLPLPPQKDDYLVKFLVKVVKEVQPDKNVVLQAPSLRFAVKSTPVSWWKATVVITAIGLLGSVSVVYFRGAQKRKRTCEPIVAAEGSGLATATGGSAREEIRMEGRPEPTGGIGGNEPATPSDESGVEKIHIERWEDLGIGIDEERKYRAITPCPQSGAVVQTKRMVELGLSGEHWERLFKLMALSRQGNSAREEDVLVAFGWVTSKASDTIRAELRTRDLSEVSKQAGKPTHHRLAIAIADLSRRLREHVTVENLRDKRPPLSMAEPGCVRSRFVVRYLLHDEDDKIHFGKAE